MYYIPIFGLIALQILVVDLVTDGLTALALAVDPGDPDIMKHPPRDPKKKFFDKFMISYLAGIGLWTMLASLGVFLWALNSGMSPTEAQCLCFASLVVVELFNCFNCRSEKYSIFSIGFFSNKWLVAAVISSLAITLALIYVPILQAPFHTYSMSLQDWGIVTLAGASVLFIVETAKTFIRWLQLHRS